MRAFYHVPQKLVHPREQFFQSLEPIVLKISNLWKNGGRGSLPGILRAGPPISGLATGPCAATFRAPMPLKKPANLKETLVLTVGSAFGLGLFPIAPGSFAALAGLALHAAAWFWLPGSVLTILIGGLVVCTVLHFWLNEAAAKYWDDTDSGNFVLDEIVGYLATALIVLPLQSLPTLATTRNQLLFMGAAFLLFRILDIIKLPGARYVDRKMHNAVGVVLDDVISGAYAAGILWAAHSFGLF